MPGIGLPAGGIRSTPARAVLWGGVGILVVTVAFAVTSWRQGSTSFDRPIDVEATVVEDGIARSGGTAPTCQPLFRYEVDGTARTARPPTRSAAACASVGDSVTIVVDAQDPERIADPAAQSSVTSALVAALGFGVAMAIAGIALRVRERHREVEQTR